MKQPGRTMKRLAAMLLLLPLPFGAHGAAPALSYLLTVDTAAFSGFSVELTVRNAPVKLRLAFIRHPEYEEEFWKNLRSFTASEGGKALRLIRSDSTLWTTETKGGTVVVRYSFVLPPSSRPPDSSGAPTRRSWRLFLTGRGGLIGGGQSFLYLPGHEGLPATVVLRLPARWNIATGLRAASRPNAFSAANADELTDSPILAGELRLWSFAIDNVPHRVAYWPLPHAVPFDSTAFLASLESIARKAAEIFGRPPYRGYAFLLQDGADDALEHLNSVTLGIPSADIAADPRTHGSQIAHEFFHTWNLVRIRPKEQRAISYLPTVPTPVLWLSEGVTLYYAEKILARAGFIDSAGIRRWLTGNLANFLQNPGNEHISPEDASLAANHPIVTDSGWRASYYTQGMILGQLLDIRINAATGGRRGLDDVMRALVANYPRSEGITGGDVERTVGEICGCGVKEFFAGHVAGSRPIAFDDELRAIGLQAIVSRSPAVDSAGRALPDTRVVPIPSPEGGHVRIVIFNAPNAWSRAGFRTDDEIAALDGSPIATTAEFRAALAGKRAGDTVAVEVRRNGEKRSGTVHLSGYDAVHVELGYLPAPSPLQRELYRRWLAGSL